MGGYSPPTPPSPLLKKAGENLLINFSGFPAKCAGGPLIGSGPLVLFARSCSGRTNAFSGEAENPGVSGGGGGGRAQSALKERARGQRPRARSFVWRPGGPCGPPRPAKRRRPPAPTPRAPPPLCQCASAGHTAVARGRRKVDQATPGRRRFAGPWPAKPPQGRGPKAPAPAVWALRAPAAPARPPSLPPTPKRQRKAWPHALWGRALKPRQEGSRQRFRPLGQSRCPCPTGSGGLSRPAAGYRRRPTPSASARRPPCA